MAGVFIGFAAHLSSTVATGWYFSSGYELYGLKKFFAGAVFSFGIMLVVLSGSELWTGNNLMTIPLCAKRITLLQMLKNWVIVWIGNFVGSFFIAAIIYKTSLTTGIVGESVIDIAAYKCSLTSSSMFFRGICCNWLVCLAIMIAVSSNDITGKIFGIFFPIMAFVTSGFEHAIANMYFILAGLFAKCNVLSGLIVGIEVKKLDAISITNYVKSLLFVSFGNLIGGAFCVGIVYWFLFLRQRSDIKE